MNISEETHDELSNIINEAWDFDKNEWKLGGVGQAVRAAFRLGYNCAVEDYRDVS